MRSESKRILWQAALSMAAAIAVAVPAGLWMLSAVPANAGEPPEGYSSELLVKLAIAAGQLDLVDRDLPVPDNIQVTRGIEYGRGGDEPLLLDLYSPKQVEENVPALVFIHGGGW